MNNPLPMLAQPLPDNLTIVPGRYSAEEKFDGHRILFRVARAKDTHTLNSWSRTGKDSGRKLDTDLAAAMAELPDGIYDAELVVPGKKHYDVSNDDNRSDRVCVVFDILEADGASMCSLSQALRRRALETIFLVMENEKLSHDRLRLAASRQVDSREQIEQFAREVWKREGEGLIVKDMTQPYKPGKRPKGAYFKVKLWQSAVAQLIRFEPSQGEIVDRGPYARMVLEDSESNLIGMKTLADEMLARFAKSGGSEIGKLVRFDYTSRTPDGKYENPVFDRFEDE